MPADELPLVIPCGEESLVGILHQPEAPGNIGTVIVVGGPQYRVGSHRQFLLLARFLAARGVPALRFDCRGMGDSSGEFAGFESVDADIKAAVDHISNIEPKLDGVILWGLCDAASACMMYAHADPRVLGMVLLNPWVRTEEGKSRTLIRNYYVRQLASLSFWGRLLRGDVKLGSAAGSFVHNVASALGTACDSETNGSDKPFTQRMTDGLAGFDGAVEIVLSGEDLTAAEFSQHAQSTAEWRQLLKRPNVRQHGIPDANHTFSSLEWRGEVEKRTLALINELSA